MTTSVVISGSGLWKPAHSISNEELVHAYNAYAEQFNQQHLKEFEEGKLKPKPLSSAEFIEKASGIKSRYVYVKDGVLDIDRSIIWKCKAYFQGGLKGILVIGIVFSRWKISHKGFKDIIQISQFVELAFFFLIEN